jgi:hypothetical protein
MLKTLCWSIFSNQRSVVKRSKQHWFVINSIFGFMEIRESVPEVWIRVRLRHMNAFLSKLCELRFWQVQKLWSAQWVFNRLQLGWVTSCRTLLIAVLCQDVFVFVELVQRCFIQIFYEAVGCSVALNNHFGRKTYSTFGSQNLRSWLVVPFENRLGSVCILSH